MAGDSKTTAGEDPTTLSNRMRPQYPRQSSRSPECVPRKRRERALPTVSIRKRAVPALTEDLLEAREMRESALEESKQLKNQVENLASPLKIFSVAGVEG